MTCELVQPKKGGTGLHDDTSSRWDLLEPCSHRVWLNATQGNFSSKTLYLPAKLLRFLKNSSFSRTYYVLIYIPYFASNFSLGIDVNSLLTPFQGQLMPFNQMVTLVHFCSQ